jgi:hypothetical protein
MAPSGKLPEALLENRGGLVITTAREQTRASIPQPPQITRYLDFGIRSAVRRVARACQQAAQGGN